MSGTEEWPAQRRAAAHAHAEHLEQTRLRETETARGQIVEFLRRVKDVGLPPERLVARSLSGNGTVRTKHLGWYIRANKSVAIGSDGHFYLLFAEKRPFFLPAVLSPSDPPLVLGAGGRDGESITLREALARVAPEITT